MLKIPIKILNFTLENISKYKILFIFVLHINGHVHTKCTIIEGPQSKTIFYFTDNYEI